MTEDDYPALSPFGTGLRCRCPRCGEGRLFQGFLTVLPECPVCHLDHRSHDSGDGPAVFIVFIVGFIVVAIALVLEMTIAPPTWVHMVIEIPLILILSFALLRPFKATFVALQYRHRAREHHLGGL